MRCELQLRGFLDSADRIQVRNQLTAKRFDEDITAAGWLRLRAGDTFTPSGHALVIGAVFWSIFDLDVLAHFAAQSRSVELVIYVFNLDDVHSAADLERFMPGVSLATRTPVIAEYKGLVLFAQYKANRRLPFSMMLHHCKTVTDLVSHDFGMQTPYVFGSGSVGHTAAFELGGRSMSRG